MATEIDESQFYEVHFRAISPHLNGIKIFTDRKTITIDNIISFDNETTEITSTDYFISSLISSIMFTLLKRAKVENIEIEEIEGTISAQLENPLALLAVKGIEGVPHFSKITMTVYVYSELDEPHFHDFCQKALNFCPIYQTIKQALPIIIKFKRL